MSVSSELTPAELVTALKSAAEPTRLRILLLLAGGELNVKDLTQILGQSQPRISRHLKLLFEAGLIERFRDGSWVYFHISDRRPGGRLALRLIADVDTSDPTIERDRSRSEAMKRDRASAAQSFFETHAADWDRIRSLHIAEGDVESAMKRSLGAGPFSFMLDLGTGTGRTLELFADSYERGLGIDVNQAMLAYARSRLVGAGCDHAQVRHGDIYALSVGDRQADAVVMHQVLHFLSEPGLAIREAARVLVPGGKLLIVDFAPHELEFLRETEAHERLGFSHEQVAAWLADAGLELISVDDLAPHSESRAEKTGNGGDKLTVTLWLAQRAGVNRARHATTTTTETREEAR